MKVKTLKNKQKNRTVKNIQKCNNIHETIYRNNDDFEQLCSTRC